MNRLMSRTAIILAGSWIGVEAYILLAHTASMMQSLLSRIGVM